MSCVDLTDENFDQIVKKNTITVIDFWAEWCGPCTSFAPIFAEVATKNTGITFAKVDIDSQRGLAEAFAVRSVPQVVIMKEDVVVYSESGTLPASSLQNLIDQARAVDVSVAKQ